MALIVEQLQRIILVLCTRKRRLNSYMFEIYYTSLLKSRVI